MNVFTRSWAITKSSISVISKDKELLLFPFLGSIFSILFIAVLLVPTIVMQFLASGQVLGIMNYVLLFITYLGLAFIATFFNVCVVYTAKTRFEGGNATFASSIGFALSRIHLIFIWSIVSATVGLLLKILDDIARKSKGAGKILLMILRGILGMAWDIATLFVIPVMVYEGVGPFQAIKRSVIVLRKTWGESLIRHFGVGIIQAIFIFVGLILGIILTFLLAALGPIAFLIGIAITVIYVVLTVLFFTVLNTIFNTALYVYGTTGKVPEGFSSEQVSNAFKSEKPIRSI